MTIEHSFKMKVRGTVVMVDGEYRDEQFKILRSNPMDLTDEQDAEIEIEASRQYEMVLAEAMRFADADTRLEQLEDR